MGFSRDITIDQLQRLYVLIGQFLTHIKDVLKTDVKVTFYQDPDSEQDRFVIGFNHNEGDTRELLCELLDFTQRSEFRFHFIDFGPVDNVARGRKVMHCYITLREGL